MELRAIVTIYFPATCSAIFLPAYFAIRSLGNRVPREA